MTEHDPSLDDNDDEFELEPIDPEIIKHQQERAKRKTREAEDAVDINAAFDEGDMGDPVDWERLRQFRFTTRHLLIATAVLAMVMTIFVRLEGCMGIFVTGCIALGAGWWIVLREEQRRLAEIARQREEFAHRQAMRRAVEDGEPVPQLEPGLFQAVSNDWEAENAAQPGFKFAFSMKELFIAFTLAAIVFGLLQIVGFETAALALGFLALLGVVVQAIGFDMAPLVVLGWWMLMAMYILISAWVVISPGS